MKKILLALALFVSLSANSQSCYVSRIAGMFSATNTDPIWSYPGNNSISSAAIGDSVYFVVDIENNNCKEQLQIIINGVIQKTISFDEAKKDKVCKNGVSPCDGKQYTSGTYKIGFKIPEMVTGSKTLRFYPSTNALDLNITVTEATTASIKDALSVNKQGIISFYDISGKLLKTGDLNNYKEGLESGKLYLYKVLYFDNTFASGKLIFE